MRDLVKKRAYDRDYYQKHKERKRVYRLERYHTDAPTREAHRGRGLLRKYGLSGAEYDQMLEWQDGVCALCGATATWRSHAVDHDHATEQIRMILCADCNQGLGKFKDDPELLRAAAQYVEAFRP